MRAVHSLEELLRLPRDGRVNGLALRTPVRLDIPGLTRHAQNSAQASLNALQSRCGCLAAGITTLAVLIAGLYLTVQRNPSLPSWHAFTDAASTLAAAFAAGLVAKLATLLFTRWQFALLCRRQHRRLTRQLLNQSNGDRDVALHSMGR